MVGQEHGADGSELSASVLDFFDTGCMRVIDMPSVDRVAEGIAVLTLVGRRVGAQSHRKRISLDKSAPSDTGV